MKTKKLLIIFLCALLIATFAVGFSACNKDKKEEGPSEQELRNSACIDLTVAILGRLDSNWGGLLNDEQIHALKNGGDYILSYEWTNFFVGAVKSSGVQTAKITKATDFIKSDDGAKIFADELDVNAIAKLMREIGVTSDDAKNIAFDLSRSLVTDSDGVFARTIERIDTIPVSATARANAVEVKEECNNSLSSLSSVTSKKNEIATSLDNASNGLKALFAFAYKAADLLAGDENFVNKISSGTLSGVSMDEIVTYLNGVNSSVQELESVLTDSEVGKINSALKLVNDNLSVAIFANDTVNSFVGGLNTAYMAAGYLPTICDLFDVVSETVLTKNLEGTTKEYQTIADFITVNSGEEYAVKDNEANNNVLAIRAMLFALGVNPYLKDSNPTKYSEQVVAAKNKAKELFDEFASKSDGAYEKEIIFIYLSGAVNQKDLEKVLGDGVTVKKVGELLQKDLALTIFKNAYKKYSAGDKTAYNTVRDSARTLVKYYTGDENAILPDTLTSAWYGEVVKGTKEKMQEEFALVLPAVKADLKNWYIDFLFEKAFDALVDVAVESPVKLADENYNALVEKIENAASLMTPQAE